MKSINSRYFKQLAIALIAIVAVISPVSCSSYDPNSRRNYSGKVEPITIGMEATPVNSLIYIAENQEYFAANGLKVTIKDDYPSGSAATDGMLKGEVDIATAAELAIVRQAFEQQKINMFGSIDKFMHQYLIGRKDRGITSISDLKGKKIGAPLKTGAQFNLSRFLDLHGIDEDQISLVDVQAPQAVGTLIEGDVDAIVAWQPNVMNIKERLGDKASIWSIHNGQPTYCAVVATNAWTKKHPELINRFLSSLSQAEEYLINNRVQARAIVQKRLNYNEDYIEAIWPEHQLSLTLDQSLIVAMEDQARWMISNKLTDKKETPDFLDYIYIDGLKEVKPKAVNIIR